MRGTLRIITPKTRSRVAQEVMNIPDGFEVVIREPTRSLDSNARMWAMLTDISHACPDGRKHSPEVWKALFMHALQYEVRFEQGLNGEPFPVGFRTSRLNKGQMADLITFISEYGDRHQVQWSEKSPYERED